ncbi:hypothetical protein [Nostoc sp.]
MSILQEVDVCVTEQPVVDIAYGARVCDRAFDPISNSLIFSYNLT